MAQVNTPPASPRAAARVRRAVDRTLDAGLFKALGDPTRLRLLSCLAKCGRACAVTEVAGCCAVDLSVVSRHLAVLERAGAVEASKQGRTVLYRVKYADLAALFRRMADAMEECCPKNCGCAAGGACGPGCCG